MQQLHALRASASRIRRRAGARIGRARQRASRALSGATALALVALVMLGSGLTGMFSVHVALTVIGTLLLVGSMGMASSRRRR